MPITQERFITVLQAAKAILDKQRNIRQVNNDFEQVISEANAALERINDPIITAAIRPLFGLANTISSIVKSSDNVFFDLAVTVTAELKHFDKVKVANARAARLQRQERERKGIRPRQDYLLGEQLAPTMTPTLQPLFLDGTIPNKPTQIPLEETQGFKNFAETMRKQREAEAKNREKENAGV